LALAVPCQRGVNDSLVCKVGFPDKWPLAQLLPTCQRVFPVTTGPKLRVPVVSGKTHRKMPNKAVLLKGFRIRCEVNGNLMIHAR
jgi:hypothetical protein